jgi:hypothetical protein
MTKFWIAIANLTIAIILSGCMASMSERHYIIAHDSETDVTNFFRVDFTGRSFLSGSKFSLGEYDRTAVNQIFSESDIKREYLAKKIDLLDKDGKKIEDITSALDASKKASADAKKKLLENLNSSLQESLGRLKYIATGDGSIKTFLDKVLPEIDSERQKGEDELKSGGGGDLVKASSHLRRASGALTTVRNIVIGKKTVRYFDADGNELDVVNKSILVFVATDSSKFTGAISQVVESENAQKSLFLAMAGSDINEQQLLENQVKDSNVTSKALMSRIEGLIASSKGNSILQGKAIFQIAKEVAGKVSDFTDPDEIRIYSQAMGDEQ